MPYANKQFSTLDKPGQSLSFFLSVTLNASRFSDHSHYSVLEVTCFSLFTALAHFSACITWLSLMNCDKQSPKATVEEQQQTDNCSSMELLYDAAENGKQKNIHKTRTTETLRTETQKKQTTKDARTGRI